MKKVILMFVESPTAEDKAKAQKYGAKLRDSNAYHEGDSREVADFRIGDAPGIYADLPEFDVDAFEKDQKRQAAEREKAEKDAIEAEKKAAKAAAKSEAKN